jgi:hypothetical protein
MPATAPRAVILSYTIIGFLTTSIGDPAVIFPAADFIKSKYRVVSPICIIKQYPQLISSLFCAILLNAATTPDSTITYNTFSTIMGCLVAASAPKMSTGK